MLGPQEPRSRQAPPVVDIRYASSQLGEGQARYTAETRRQVTQAHSVALRDGRHDLGRARSRQQLREHGFAFVGDFRPSVHDDLDKVENPPVYRSGGEPESPLSSGIREVYYSECERLVKDLTGADFAMAISHAVRSAASNRLSSGVEYLTAYATFAHTDYTEDILPNAWKMLAKRGVPEAQARKMRIAFFNVWQPTRVPVEQNPLALLDWTSVDPADVVKVTLGYSVTPKAGQTVAPPIGQLRHNAGHRWYFFPNLQTHEALVFTQVDSRPGYPRHSFHTSVKHATKADPVPRQSVEVRIVCGFLGPEDPAPHARASL